MQLISVVIPTHKRPKQVARAISSAIEVHAGFDIEILVIPNGNDESWKAVAESYKHDLRIRWLHLSQGNACAARNHGLSNAKGKYLRFLDDDDYLLPAAADQLLLIENGGHDVFSGPLANAAADGRLKHCLALPETNDFAVAAVLPNGISLNQGSIFRRSSIQGARWRENAVLYDDYFWMLDLAASREMAWACFQEPVAAYVQHDGSRLSRVMRSHSNSCLLADAIIGFHRHLSETGRMTSERNLAIARALLTHAHSSFPASPLLLSASIRQAMAIDPAATPLQPIFKKYPVLSRHLLAAEWAVLPVRFLTRSYRRATWSLGKLIDRIFS